MLNQSHGEKWTLYNADCVEGIEGVPSNSVGLSVFSPPFSSLYIYSAFLNDMGNCKDDEEFFQQFMYLLPELYRVTIPGRLCVIHCKDLVDYKNTAGRAGLRDFPGDIIRAMEAAGWKYHSRVTIWTDPVLEMQKTKAHGLLYCQLRKDSSFSRQGLPDYLLVFRKWQEEGDDIQPVTHTHEEFPLDQWQLWASPVWMDIQRTDVLNCQIARDNEDEKHICPLQLEVIRRCVRLWSNPGDVILSPFAGIGSEGYVAVKEGRRFVGFELKPGYFSFAGKNLQRAELESRQESLFAGVDVKGEAG